MKKSLLFVLAALLICSTVMLAGCGGSSDKAKEETTKETTEAAASDLTDWDYIKDRGELIVGLDDTFAPMGFRDEENKLVGFDIDLATAVGKELGVKVTFKPIDWDAKELELKAKKIDCIWNGMSVTPNLKESLSLSNKYLNNKIIIMTMDDKVKITKAEDLAKYQIATQSDSAALKLLKANKAYDSYKDNITDYKSYDDAIMDLKTGRRDCVVIDQVLGQYKNSKAKKDKMLVCDFDFGDDYYVIGFRKEDTKLTDHINKAIKATIDSGEAEKVSKKWFGKNIVIFEELD